MRIGIPAEIRPGETRVAATPETVRKMTQAGLHTVVVQSGAGAAAKFPDAEYVAAGATLASGAPEVFAQSDIILKVRGPEMSELTMLRPGMVLACLLATLEPERLEALARTGVTAFRLESIPRITRAQTMDVLSSQGNIAGYKAVILAADAYDRYMPMLMTAAGTVKAARVLILGAGVAGLQAIATAKRLGAVVEAFDVRPAVKEQVESLGAKFVEVPVSEEEKKAAETAGGYAREMSEDYQRRQAELIDERARAADIVITTALIPGRAAPILIREDTVKGMKPGSVIVDLAVKQGGNCPLSELDTVVVKHGVKIIGHGTVPALIPTDASAMYARNLLHFFNLLVDPKTGELKLDRTDEIIAGALACADGAVVRG
jgi:H+-translocating NAD(P) transhydrogenase subunit alpha